MPSLMLSAEITTPAPERASTNKFTLWVGDLDKNVTERELYQIFSTVGSVSSVHLCTDAVSRTSLGHAYINFADAATAEKALETKNYEEVRGRQIRVMWSQRDPTIRKAGAGNVFIKNLDKTIDSKKLHDTLSQFGHIMSCKVATEPNGVSKGYGFVHFERKEGARECIIQVNGREIEGKIVNVGPFLARTERIPDLKEIRFTNVFVKNLPEQINEEKLSSLFEPYGSITSAVVIRDGHGTSKGFGFVNYGIPEEAHVAVKAMDGIEIDGERIYVGRAQKKSERVASLTRVFEERKRDRIAQYQGLNLYVKYLPDDFDDTKLRELFSVFGAITSCKVMMDEKTGKSKGFGFVCFSNVEDAQHALTMMLNKPSSGKPLYVSIAQQREVRRQQLEMHFRVPATDKHGVKYPNVPPPFLGTPWPCALGIPRSGIYPRISGSYRSHSLGLSRGGIGVRSYGYKVEQSEYIRPGDLNKHSPGRGNRGRGRAVGRTVCSPSNIPTRATAPRDERDENYKPSKDPFHPWQAIRDEPCLRLEGHTNTRCFKHRVGEEIFPLVHKLEPDLAGRITGMLLEMNVKELMGALENPVQLKENVKDALEVLLESGLVSTENREHTVKADLEALSAVHHPVYRKSTGHHTASLNG